MPLTLTNHGTHDASGAALKVAVDAINPLGHGQSGSGLFLIPAGFGQIQVLEVVGT